MNHTGSSKSFARHMTDYDFISKYGSSARAQPSSCYGGCSPTPLPAANSCVHRHAYKPYHTSANNSSSSSSSSSKLFWADQYREIEQTTDFKNHSLPLARIKKIMKADEDVRMIAAEAPVVFARACEMFILELTHRSWAHAEENKRRTLQKNDIAAAITRTDVFDFLVDIVPREEGKEDMLGAAAGVPRALVGNDPLSYYYVQQ
ncbi:uncharacterized protein A4U43_C01F35330 [Asparagus officinalis]|uniref:Core Histone H2A/H2B/H3 domain-containing protein n=1 Tax=Asparagus officinalis TaxID=4686 RepID=A0A5P1FV61_ASPOF|nr:uncharacterized protein A4U43_C01F35330 [Asparagus officinalis]